MANQWHLEMALVGPFGQRLVMKIGIEEHIAGEISLIEPPCPMPGLQSFDQTVAILKRREFRKDLFIREAQRLGALLAERMEDAEGWHDASRVEPAKAELSR